MAAEVHPKIAIAEHPHTSAIRGGAIPIEGVDAGFVAVRPQIDASKVTWVVDAEEHVTQLKLPPSVVHAPAGTSLAEMMASGELVGQRCTASSP